MTSTVLACTVEVRHTYHGDDEFSGPAFVPFRQIAFTWGSPDRCMLLCACRRTPGVSPAVAVVVQPGIDQRLVNPAFPGRSALVTLTAKYWAGAAAQRSETK